MSGTDHARRFALERDGTPVLANLAGAYALEPNAPYALTLIVDQPRLTVAGAQFDWTLPDPQEIPANEHQADVFSFVLPGVFEHGMNFDHSPWGRHDYYLYRVRRYLGAVQVSAGPITLSARDSATLDLEVGLYRDRSCDQALTLISSRASIRSAE